MNSREATLVCVLGWAAWSHWVVGLTTWEWLLTVVGSMLALITRDALLYLQANTR